MRLELAASGLLVSPVVAVAVLAYATDGQLASWAALAVLFGPVLVAWPLARLFRPSGGSAPIATAGIVAFLSGALGLIAILVASAATHRGGDSGAGDVVVMFLEGIVIFTLQGVAVALVLAGPGHWRARPRPRTAAAGMPGDWHTLGRWDLIPTARVGIILPASFSRAQVDEAVVQALGAARRAFPSRVRIGAEASNRADASDYHLEFRIDTVGGDQSLAEHIQGVFGQSLRAALPGDYEVQVATTRLAEGGS